MSKRLLSLIIKTASDAYDDGLVEQYWDWKYGEHRSSDEPGDTLAKFIAIELGEVYDPEAERSENLAFAVHAMDNAIEQLQAVRDALDRLPEKGLEEEPEP